MEIKDLRKLLKGNNYKYFKSVCNRVLNGWLKINTITETYIKNNTKIVVETDNERNKINILYYDINNKNGLDIDMENIKEYIIFN